jgi:hypothetical protein
VRTPPTPPAFIPKCPRLAVLIACAAMAGVGCGGPRQPKRPGDFARYPSSPAFDAVVQAHADAATDREQSLVLTTWFLNGDPAVAMRSSVRGDGHVSVWRYLHDAGALTSSPGKDLVETEKAELQQVLEQLPPSEPPEARENLLIVSHRDAAGRWVTRLYDRMRRPEAVSNLFVITGAPIQPER